MHKNVQGDSWKMICNHCGICCKELLIRFSQEEYTKLILQFPDINKSINKSITSKDELNVVFANGCPFLKDNKCVVYDDRPEFCKAYPVIIGEKGIMITTACPCFDTITTNDIAHAMQAFAAFNGKTAREKNRFVRKYSLVLYNKLKRRLFYLVEKLDNDPLNLSLMIEAKEFIQHLKNHEDFDKWINEIKNKAWKLNKVKELELKETPDD